MIISCRWEKIRMIADNQNCLIDLIINPKQFLLWQTISFAELYSDTEDTYLWLFDDKNGA